VGEVMPTTAPITTCSELLDLNIHMLCRKTHVTAVDKATSR
jgi:hypothetical protein